MCRIVELPYFGLCVGEVFLQPGQAVQQGLRRCFIYSVISGKVQVKLVLGDGARRQTPVSLFTAKRDTVWQMPSGNTCCVLNYTNEPAAKRTRTSTRLSRGALGRQRRKRRRQHRHMDGSWSIPQLLLPLTNVHVEGWLRTMFNFASLASLSSFFSSYLYTSFTFFLAFYYP